MNQGGRQGFIQACIDNDILKNYNAILIFFYTIFQRIFLKITLK